MGPGTAVTSPTPSRTSTGVPDRSRTRKQPSRRSQRTATKVDIGTAGRSMWRTRRTATLPLTTTGTRSGGARCVDRYAFGVMTGKGLAARYLTLRLDVTASRA